MISVNFSTLTFAVPFAVTPTGFSSPWALEVHLGSPTKEILADSTTIIPL